mgnify:CR=1 FL=1
MRIFIGSSKARKVIAARIADALAAQQFQVLRWWDPAVFKGGDVTIDRLIEMSNICDGAVFVFGADDDIVIKRKKKPKVELVAPRDNVILEYGMFAGKRGRKKTLFVTQKDVKVPTDLKGVTYIGDKEYVGKVVTALKEALGEAPPSEVSKRVVMHVSRGLLERVRSGIPDRWCSRALYIGSRGANAWAAVENDPSYSGSQDFVRVQGLIEKLAKKHRITNSNCIVSFGPGLGLLDKMVLPALAGSQMVQYIPVDINDYLAVHAADVVDKASRKTHVPFCIVADFEDEMSIIAEIVKEHTSPGRVFMMLGGTFGNLEAGEESFLRGLHDCMEPGDIAILDVFIAGKGYEIEKDTYRDLAGQSESIKRFLAGGIERRCNVRVETVMEKIEDYIEFKYDITRSNVGKTAEFEYRCKVRGHPLIYVRRYDFEAFRDHLENRDFKVIDAGSVKDPGKLVERAVYFIKKK